MTLHTPATIASDAMTEFTFPTITKAELDQALRRSRHRQLTIPAIVVEEQPLLDHLSLIHLNRPWTDLDETGQQQLTSQCRQLMHGRGWSWHSQLEVKRCPTNTAVYRQWLAPDLEKLESGLQEYLHVG